MASHNKKNKLHLRNRHRNRYDFPALIATCPELSAFVSENAYHDLSINFFDPIAVKMLNKALLMHYYDITYWDIPSHYLCPAIPGRADYIHYIADLLAEHQNGIIPTGTGITCLDIGVGANCVYPIIGRKEYGWSFIGVDIDPVALQSANQIIQRNPTLKGHVELRLQSDPNSIFAHILKQNEIIHIVICNPPFHASLAEAKASTQRKLSQLTQEKSPKFDLNFGGLSNELYCNGGELKFIKNMINESQDYAHTCFWFSTYVSKKDNIAPIRLALKKVKAVEIKIIPMEQGNKASRVVAWTFIPRDKKSVT